MLRAGASWCDLVKHAGGRVEFVYMQGTTLVCEHADTGVRQWRREGMEQVLLYLRAAADASGRVCAIGQGHNDGSAWATIDGGGLFNLGVTACPFPVLIFGDSLGWVAFIQRTTGDQGRGINATYDVIRIHAGGGHVTLSTREMSPTSQGFLYVASNGQPITQDLGRGAIPGLALPSPAPSDVTVWAGQSMDAPTLALFDSEAATITLLDTPGGQPPHIVESNGTFYVCSYVKGGAWLSTHRRPFPSPTPKPEPERLPEGTELDLLPFLIGEASTWPRHGDHYMHQAWDGRNLHFMKFGPVSEDSTFNDNWERLVLDGDQFFLREDRSQSGAGIYSFHPGTAFRRRMKVGEWIDVPNNVLQRYDPKTCEVIDQHPLPYRIGLVEAWKHFDCGGDLGVRNVIKCGYDPGNRHDTIEYSWYADGASWFRWQEQRQDDPTKTHTQSFNRIGGVALTPTQGCWRRDLVPWPPKDPDPVDEEGMTKTELFGVDINRGFVLGAWTRFIQEVAMGRDVIDGTTREEGLTDTVGTRGLAMYFFPHYYRETMKAIDRLGHVPRNDAEWGHVSVAGFEAASAIYLREQGGGNPGGGHVDPGTGGLLTPLRVSGRNFANDAGLFDYRELSAFGAYARWLQGRHEQLGQLASVSRAHKVTSWRVILTLSGDFWHNIGTPCGPSIAGFYDHLVPFTRWCASQGLYVRFCPIGGIEEFGGNPVDRRDDFRAPVRERAYDYLRRVVSALAGEPNILWNVANEWNQIGLRDSFDRVVEMGRIIKSIAPHHILNLSETNGPIADDPMWVREPADFVDAHLDRRTGIGGFEWVKRSSESPVVDNDRMPFLSGEPINFGTPAPGRPDDCEPSPAVAFCYGATSKVKRYQTNFHYHGGLTADVPDAATQACLDGWRRGLDAIPLGFPGGWCNGHHGCSPWDIDNFPRQGDNEDAHGGPIRIFGLSGSDGYIGVSVREKSGRRPRERRPVQEVDRVEWGGYASAVYRA